MAQIVDQIVVTTAAGGDYQSVVINMQFPAFCDTELDGKLLSVYLYRQKFRSAYKSVNITFKGSSCPESVDAVSDQEDYYQN